VELDTSVVDVSAFLNVAVQKSERVRNGFTRPVFASIGHSETWKQATAVINAFRTDESAALSVEEVREIAPQLEPRPIVNIVMRSFPQKKEVHGLYIETFISIDNLTFASTRSNLQRVRDAAACAARQNVGIVALGGFTSILLEGNTDFMSHESDVVFTTGNTLTAAYIVKGIEQACRLKNLNIAESNILIVGSTGDLGSGCVRYFEDKAKSLLLCARNQLRLGDQELKLLEAGRSVRASTKLSELAPEADIVILVASTVSDRLDLSDLPAHAVICDAGYPKNAQHNAATNGSGASPRLFYGGMGLVRGGFEFSPDVKGAIYDFPDESIAHGCTLEAPLLALEDRYESFSSGRGDISVDAIEEIWAIAQSHGFVLAPLFNVDGLWENQS